MKGKLNMGRLTDRVSFTMAIFPIAESLKTIASMGKGRKEEMGSASRAVSRTDNGREEFTSTAAASTRETLRTTSSQARANSKTKTVLSTKAPSETENSTATANSAGPTDHNTEATTPVANVKAMANFSTSETPASQRVYGARAL